MKQKQQQQQQQQQQQHIEINKILSLAILIFSKKGARRNGEGIDGRKARNVNTIIHKKLSLVF
jgi:hypothetical protein